MLQADPSFRGRWIVADLPGGHVYGAGALPIGFAPCESESFDPGTWLGFRGSSAQDDRDRGVGSGDDREYGGLPGVYEGEPFDPFDPGGAVLWGPAHAGCLS